MNENENKKDEQLTDDQMNELFDELIREQMDSQTDDAGKDGAEDISPDIEETGQEETRESDDRDSYVPKFAASDKGDFRADEERQKEEKNANKAREKEEKSKQRAEKRKQKKEKKSHKKAHQKDYDEGEIVRVSKPAEETAESEEDKRKRLTRKSVLGIIASVILIAGVLFVAFFTPKDKTVTIKRKISNSPFPIAMTDEIRKVEVTNECVYILSGTNLACFTEEGKQIDEFKLSFSAPRMIVTESLALVYDSQGNGYNIYKGETLINSNKSKDESQIVCASIGENGDYLIVTRPQVTGGISSCLTYYDRNGNEKFSWQCKDYIVKAEISTNSRTIAAVGLNSDLVNVYSKVYAIPVDEFSAQVDSNLFSKRFNSPLLYLSLSGDDSISVVLKQKLVTFNINNYKKSKKSVNFKGDVQLISTDGNGYTAVVCSSDSKQVLYVYDRSCALEYKLRLDDEAKDIVNFGKNVYLLTGSGLDLIKSADKTKRVAEFDIIQRAIANYGRRLYTYSSNLFFGRVV